MAGEILTANEIIARTAAAYAPYWYATWIELGIIIVLILLGLLIWSWMRPVLSYIPCRNNPNRPWMWIFQKNKRIKPFSGHYFAEVYEIEDKENLMAFFKADNEGYKVGSADLELFYEGIDRAVSPRMAIMVRTLRDLGYKSIRDATEALNRGLLPKTKDGAPAIYMPLFTQFDPSVIEDWVKSKPAILKAYADTKVNMERHGNVQKFYENPQIMALAFVIIAGCLGIGLLKSMGVF
jgi:hypothetical protein